MRFATFSILKLVRELGVNPKQNPQNGE